MFTYCVLGLIVYLLLALTFFPNSFGEINVKRAILVGIPFGPLVWLLFTLIYVSFLLVKLSDAKFVTTIKEFFTK